MNDEISVSVCIITYNHEKYIAQCLDSVLGQKTNFKFNIFVSDDCSQDSTLEIVNRYKEKHPNINVTNRCGLQKSFVKGRPTGNMNLVENIARANGKYIALCDGDDYWAFDSKLQTQFDVLENRPDIGVVCSSKTKVIDNVLLERKIKFPDIEFSYRWLCFYNPIPSSSSMFPKANFIFPPQWYFDVLEVGDWPLWFQVARKKRVLKLSIPFLNYRIHAGGFWMQSMKSQKALSSLTVVKVLEKNYGDKLFKISSILHYIRYVIYKNIDLIRTYASKK